MHRRGCFKWGLFLLAGGKEGGCLVALGEVWRLRWESRDSWGEGGGKTRIASDEGAKTILNELTLLLWLRKRGKKGKAT